MNKSREVKGSWTNEIVDVFAAILLLMLHSK